MEEVADLLRGAPSALQYLTAMKQGRDKFKAVYGVHRWKEEYLAFILSYQFMKSNSVSLIEIVMAFDEAEATTRRHLKTLYNEGRIAKERDGFIVSMAGFVELATVAKEVMSFSALRDAHFK
jgi:DNA-binding transcriptional ArsR family regulator